MPKIVIHHEVEDTERWLTTGKATRENFFGALGITDIKPYTNPENPQQVALTMDVPDLDAMMASLEPPRPPKPRRRTGSRATPSFSTSRRRYEQRRFGRKAAVENPAPTKASRR